MYWPFTISEAARGVLRTPVRSALSALGIVVGVASVIAMLSLGKGARAQVEAVFARLDSNQLILSAMPPRKDWRYGIPPPMSRGDGLQLSDYRAIETHFAGVASVSVEVGASGPREVKTMGVRSDGQLIGLDILGVELSGRKIIRGSTLSADDVRNAASVALISEHLAQILFKDTDALGGRVAIAETPFTIIGVVENRRIDAATEGVTADTSVLMPYTSLLRRISPLSPITLILKPRTPEMLPVVQQVVTDLLEQRRGKRRAEFMSSNIAAAVSAYGEGSRTMSRLLAAVGTIALAVGGIGLANIMLVSVTERTREIGVRIALGTRPLGVQSQILLEAIALCLVSGTIGVLLGAAIAAVLTRLYDWPTLTAVSALLGVLLGTVFLGAASGWYPARRASQLDPVRCLRAD
ncbi:MAG: ABC transporter permease [Gammaproteobacteria bacterium]